MDVPFHLIYDSPWTTSIVLHMDQTLIPAGTKWGLPTELRNSREIDILVNSETYVDLSTNMCYNNLDACQKMRLFYL